MKRARSTRHTPVLRSSPEKREKLAPILQANYKETGRDTEILEMNRDWVLSFSKQWARVCSTTSQPLEMKLDSDYSNKRYKKNNDTARSLQEWASFSELNDIVAGLGYQKT